MAENPYIELAKMFKNNENKYIHGICVGDVVNVSPITIKINNSINTSENNSVVSSRIIELIDSNKLNRGDSVIVMVSTNNKQFFILDKAV